VHHIYHTEGIILSSKNSGEAGKYYALFTRDLGMVYASASGVRKMSSKLRYILQDYSLVKVDLVRGKDFWRLTSATKSNNLEEVTKNTKTLAVVTRVAKLLKRLLAGEDANEALFLDVVSGLTILEKCKTGEETRNIEVVLVLRILGHLGYIGEGENVESLIKSPFEQSLVFEVAKSRPEILNQINKALKETHL